MYLCCCSSPEFFRICYRFMECLFIFPAHAPQPHVICNRKLGGMHLFFSHECTIRELLWCSDKINPARCGAGCYKIAGDLKIKLNTNECLKPDLSGWHYRSLSAGKQQADLFASFIGCKKDQRISFLQADRFVGLHDSNPVPS